MGSTVRDAGIVRLFEAEPDLIAHLDPATRRNAIRQTVVERLEAPPGEYGPCEIAASDGDFALLVLDGLLIRRLDLFGRTGVELLGQGDVLPALVEETYTSLAPETSMKVLERVTLAVLDREFERAASVWPGVLPRVLARFEDRLAAVSLRLAIAKFPRLDDRVLCVLWQLADRWGHRTADGVHVPLRLSHDVLADRASARRPSVSEAIKRLTRQGLVSRSDRTWILHGDPPRSLGSLSAELALPPSSG